jgi:transcriptional regulator
MYLPKEFAEDRIPVLHDAMRTIAFGTLVTTGADGLTASHIPLLLDAEPAPYGTLTGHLARGNPQGRGPQSRGVPAEGVEALAMFLGPHAYVSPSWYPSKQENGKVVPTWNYVAIHAHGTLRFIDDLDWKIAHVTRLTASHESRRAAPWAVSDAPPDYITGMAKGIIGFALPIARLYGKWKMSQNRLPADRVGAAEGLRREGNADVAAIVTDRAIAKT